VVALLEVKLTLAMAVQSELERLGAAAKQVGAEARAAKQLIP
jgi:hypothetical protein